ncbi:Hsp20/alpha crystallin family protein [Actinoplanes sp. NBRC 101535]|uniref:Hsp20/alpha crystallin family protein n=1 Tax=Actinoplanes sp. NBRC 101535 TaxID=3032196 RepID=UPI0024A59E14|nr:Hsp20/alpha crystallin family protein [Actinoplanes sp. NBRC 101535]GLY06453.1 hypothetical protein Acsp01_68320 [Actinoplanes sp. NBRC 101535]
MSTLLPWLLGDMSESFEVDLPRLRTAIRMEERITDQEYVLRAELPGLDPEKDVQLSTLNGVLTLRAERREENRELGRSEFRYGMLYRSLRLPANAEETAIAATYDKGILEITIPLTAPERAGQQIAITRK